MKLRICLPGNATSISVKNCSILSKVSSVAYGMSKIIGLFREKSFSLALIVVSVLSSAVLCLLDLAKPILHVLKIMLKISFAARADKCGAMFNKVSVSFIVGWALIQIDVVFHIFKSYGPMQINSRTGS